MTRASASLGRGGILVAVAALGLASPLPAHGAGEPSMQVLPGSSHAAVVADLDADGARELVRITSDPGPDGDRVDAWEHDGDGWVEMGSALLERRDGDGDGDVMVDVGVDAAALLVWHDRGRERVIALTSGSDPLSEIGETCCLTLAEVVRDGSRLELRRMLHDGGAAFFVQVLDVEDDGTDELALFGVAGSDGRVTTVELLRWSGSAFEAVGEPATAGTGFAAWVGNSDGVTGDDLIVGPSETGELVRYSWADGEHLTEEVSLGVEDAFSVWVAGIADGALVMAFPDEAQVVRWPRGGRPTVVARASGFAVPSITVVGSGADALVITQEGFTLPGSSVPAASVYDLQLRPLGRTDVSDAAAHLWRVVERGIAGSVFPSRLLYPYTGLLTGFTLDGRDAYLVAGQLIQPDGMGSFVTQAIAPLAGARPVGVLGADEAWIALTNSYFPPPSIGYLFPAGAAADVGRVTLVPLDDVLDPVDEERATVELRNAISDAPNGQPVGSGRTGEDGPIALRAHRDGFQAVVTAPSASWVVVTIGSEVDELTVGEEPLVVEIAAPPRRAEDGDLGFEATLIVATPDGHALVREWEGTFVRESPEIVVSGRTDLLSLSATITGSIGPAAVVAVDGQPVETGAGGQFEVTVDAPIWPRTVQVVVSDGLGNDASQMLEVVGLFDYRGLPWVAIVVTVTIAAGVVLFVRTPQRRRASEGKSQLDEGRLQELDLEELEELERAELGGR